MADDELWQWTARESTAMLYKLAYSLLHCDADAQDAVSQTLLRTWEKRAGIRDASLRAYMTRTLINECHNIQRQRGRVEYVEEYPPIAAPQMQENREVYEAIAALPEKLRLPVYLKYLEDLSEAEAAQALRIPVTTFKGRLHRARMQLRRILDREVTLE